MTKTQSLIAIPAIVATLLAGGALAGYATLASAQSSGAETFGRGMMTGMRDRGPHVHGTVTAVSGTTITITYDRSDTAYTIDASSATFKKSVEGAAPVTVTISEIAIGDKIGAMGTLSGTTLKATHVMEGEIGRGGAHGKGGHGRGPGVMGKVTAVNGSTITVTGDNGTTYTVNAGSASIHKMTTGALSDIAVGDTIGVHGDVSGTTVAAEMIMTDMPMHAAQAKTQ